MPERNFPIEGEKGERLKSAKMQLTEIVDCLSEELSQEVPGIGRINLRLNRAEDDLTENSGALILFHGPEIRALRAQYTDRHGLEISFGNKFPRIVMGAKIMELLLNKFGDKVERRDNSLFFKS